MNLNSSENNNNESQNISNNNTESSTAVKKLNISHVAKAKLLRQKLREKKNKLEAEKNSDSNGNEESPNTIIPNNSSNSSSNNFCSIFQENDEEKEKEKINPLKFVFSNPSENRKDDNNSPFSYLNEIKEEKDEENINDESSEMPKIIILEASNPQKEDLNINKFETPYPKNNKLISPQQQNIQNKTTTKQYQFSKFAKQSDSDWDSSSSSDDDFEKSEMQRLINIKNAQQNLFKKNRSKPKEAISSTNKKQNELTQEDILKKLFLDFDKTSELLELNEKKKQIMLKKMRKTLHRLSNLRLRNINPEEEAKRNLINKKIEELKKVTGDNYNSIKQNVDKIILGLRMPDYYFCDDEDVGIISEKDINNKNNIKPILDIDFSSFMRQ